MPDLGWGWVFLGGLLALVGSVIEQWWIDRTARKKEDG